MPLENTDSHNNNMAPVKDETADEEVQFWTIESTTPSLTYDITDAAKLSLIRPFHE
ncbi:predicted protein [Botrytis cinerea T4]|uniref:Uncharacterized protein n=1 Tax=Botryotinia fuckeliana (strain T4) TaxID=999810 RepID=G2YLJ0_BOTF4|nr:predicted protein [Botrytis cinerea T4]